MEALKEMVRQIGKHRCRITNDGAALDFQLTALKEEQVLHVGHFTNQSLPNDFQVLFGDIDEFYSFLKKNPNALKVNAEGMLFTTVAIGSKNREYEVPLERVELEVKPKAKLDKDLDLIIRNSAAMRIGRAWKQRQSRNNAYKMEKKEQEWYQKVEEKQEEEPQAKIRKNSPLEVLSAIKIERAWRRHKKNQQEAKNMNDAD